MTTFEDPTVYFPENNLTGENPDLFFEDHMPGEEISLFLAEDLVENLSLKFKDCKSRTKRMLSLGLDEALLASEGGSHD